VPTLPAIPAQYTLTGLITLPSANVSEPFRMFYDRTINKQVGVAVGQEAAVFPSTASPPTLPPLPDDDVHPPLPSYPPMLANSSVASVTQLWRLACLPAPRDMPVGASVPRFPSPISLQRVEYYYHETPVLNTYIIWSNEGTLYQVNPVIEAHHCFESNYVRGACEGPPSQFLRLAGGFRLGAPARIPCPPPQPHSSHRPSTSPHSFPTSQSSSSTKSRP
jgi:hypothetical protein